MAEIIRFDRTRVDNKPTLASRPPMIPPTRVEYPETPRQRAGRKRNPLRLHAERVSLAVTITGHLANGRTDRLQVLQWGDYDYVAMLRRGADAARFLADELDRVVAREEGNDETPPTVA